MRGKSGAIGRSTDRRQLKLDCICREAAGSHGHIALETAHMAAYAACSS